MVVGSGGGTHSDVHHGFGICLKREDVSKKQEYFLCQRTGLLSHQPSQQGEDKKPQREGAFFPQTPNALFGQSSNRPLPARVPWAESGPKHALVSASLASEDQGTLNKI